MTADRQLLVLDHPVVQHRLAVLRDRTTDSASFRQLVREISALVAYEALRDLVTEEWAVDTPVFPGAPCRRVAETLLLVPVLRAGLGMVQAVQELVPLTEVAHVGLRRDEETLQPEVYLNRLPADLHDRRVVICDPMLATGGSLAQVCEFVRARGATRVQALCLIAAEPGVRHFHSLHPDVPVACAALDPTLDDRGFILPGLGDAGDRLFGPPA
ncbi:MAG TPA: uracil phosphoribosyltransferase [Acidimicrobiales bacterium]|jgi:uracil phosphoribosyltransferase|nr:uracil phosphoribosyltransferase [Acidimicrobiales bacterium]